jgi:large subunit ribosomal protein L35
MAYKLKSNRGACKRFRHTGGGIKRRKTNRNHILTKKSQKRKRHLRSSALVREVDFKEVARLLHGS